MKECKWLLHILVLPASPEVQEWVRKEKAWGQREQPLQNGAISLKFWLESELEFGHENPSESSADDQPPHSPQLFELVQVSYLDVDPNSGHRYLL